MSKVGAENSNNEVNDSKNEHKLLRKGLAVALAGAVTLGAAGCSGDKVGAQAPEVNPSTTTESVAESQEVPKEAESFIDQYGSRYDDPVSVYFAQKDYEANVSTWPIILSEEYITNYEPSSGVVSDLGFEMGKFPIESEGIEGIDDFIDVFNSYTAPQLSRYMNLLARNPDPEAIKIIDNEFLNYCSANSNIGTQAEIVDDNQDVINLMNLAKSTVSKYGSAANYYVANGSSDRSNVDSTLFINENVSKGFNSETGIHFLQTSGVKLIINVDTYNNSDNINREVEIVDDAQLIIFRHPNTGSIDSPADFTYISIGLR